MCQLITGNSDKLSTTIAIKFDRFDDGLFADGVEIVELDAIERHCQGLSRFAVFVKTAQSSWEFKYNTFEETNQLLDIATTQQ